MPQNPDTTFTTDTLLPGTDTGFVQIDSVAMYDTIAVESELENGIERTFNGPSDSWLFVLLGFLTLYIGVQRLVSYGEFRKRLRSMMNLRLADQYYREEDNEGRISRLLYDAWYLMAFSAAFYFICMYFIADVQEVSGWALFAVITSAVLVLYVLKRLLNVVLSGLFEFSDMLGRFQFHDHVQLYVLSLLLVPLLWLAGFGSEWVRNLASMGIMSVVAVSILLRYVRGIALVFPQIRGFGFSFILYICTLEIAPVLALVKGLGILFQTYLS